jgi:spermidine synthase
MPKKKPLSMAPATISEADGVRYLHLGTPWVQGAMRIRKPLVPELQYIQRMMASLLFCTEEQLSQGHAVQLGLGAAAITRFCHQVLCMRTTAVELNPTVITACRVWFHLPFDDDLLRVIEGDARDFVDDLQHAGTVHTLHIDLYDHDAASPVLDDAAFYTACHRVLVDGGVLSVNLFGCDTSFERSAMRIAAVFGRDHVCSMQPTIEGNTVVLAMKNAPFPDTPTLALRAQNIQTHWKLPAKKWLRMIRTLPFPGPVP